MKITQLKIYHYQLTLHQPLMVKGAKIPFREGYLIYLTSDAGIVGFGEVSPLPGLSKETLPETLNQLKKLKIVLLNQSVPSEFFDSEFSLSSWTGELLPSVAFGLEMAIGNLLANEADISFHELLSPQSIVRVIDITGLLKGPKFHVVRLAQHMMNHQFKTVKLKVGQESLNDDIAKTQAVQKVIQGKARLILDANQSWETEEAIKFFDSLDKYGIIYVEEPLKHTAHFEQLFTKTKVPIALDESLTRFDWNTIQSLECIHTLVIKPTLIGGIHKTFEFFKKAKQKNLQVAISSAYETSLGMVTLLQLAAINPSQNPAGLDTLKAFRHDLLKNRILIKDGQLPLYPQVTGFDQIYAKFLEEITL